MEIVIIILMKNISLVKWFPAAFTALSVVLTLNYSLQVD